MADSFAEIPRRGLQQRIELRGRLWSGRSALQHVEVLDTIPFGRALVLDGALQITEADEFCYHELLVHIPLLAHSRPRRVLIVGGGDGGCLRHVLMHSVEEVVQVEIDELVVRVCGEWLPNLAQGAFKDPRARLVIGDGAAYLGSAADQFDVIVVDSTDPVGPAERLISKDFFELASSALRPEGMLAIQTGSPLLMPDELRTARHGLARAFPLAATYVGHVPSYPGVLWSFTVGSKRDDPREPRRAPTFETRYYTPDVHRAAFALPAYLNAAFSERDAVLETAGPILG
jgi:spermidine synthase